MAKDGKRFFPRLPPGRLVINDDAIKAARRYSAFYPYFLLSSYLNRLNLAVIEAALNHQ